MDNFYAITSRGSHGCTFIDWSIHFLSGQDKFFNKKLGWIPLIDNPLTEKNAHGHYKNHPHGVKATVECMDLLLAQQGLKSLYAVQLYFPDAAAELNIDLSKPLTAENFKLCLDFIENDYKAMIDYIAENNSKLIYLHLPNELYFYNIGEARANNSSMKKKSKSYDVKDHIPQEEMDKDFEELFFAESLQRWSNLGMTNIWDVRERRALDYRPFNIPWKDQFNYSVPNLRLDLRFLWANTSVVMKQILKFLDLELDQNRFDKWIPIMEQWKSLQYKKINFACNYDFIVKSIVNNWYCEIDLDFHQEVIIQHCLIYHHGLNLKTWQLEKFPNNTQELHKLLEKNFHPLTAY